MNDLNTFSIDPWGDITIRYCMIDLDGRNLEEGFEIISDEGEFEPIEIIGFDIDELTADDIEELIQNNK